MYMLKNESYLRQRMTFPNRELYFSKWILTRKDFAIKEFYIWDKNVTRLVSEPERSNFFLSRYRAVSIEAIC